MPQYHVLDVGGEPVTAKRVVFTDIHGQRGVITQELDVTYTGEWEATVTEWAADRQEEWLASGTDDADGLSVRLLLNLVMIELQDVIPVIEIERRELS